MARTKIAVLGAGSWGTAIANHLALAGHDVVIWGPEESVLRSIQDRHENSVYFPGVSLSPALQTESDISQAVKDREMVVFVVPSSAYRSVAQQLRNQLSSDTVIVSAAKGLEGSSLKTMAGVLSDEFGVPARIAALSGPSFAREVLLGLPTAVVVASVGAETVKKVSAAFHHGNFRVYSSDDVIGVEFGGVVKNVIALAAGVIDGMGMGANARAALITRGLVEMQRLALSLGGKPLTITGLSGLGDLLLTATGDLSRNRQVGIRLAKGEKVDEIVKSLGQCAEGVVNAEHLLALARRQNVEVPIIEEVAKFLAGKSTVKEALANLLTRPAKGELH